VKSQITVRAQVSAYRCGSPAIAAVKANCIRRRLELTRELVDAAAGARLSLALRYGGFQKPTTP